MRADADCPGRVGLGHGESPGFSSCLARISEAVDNPLDQVQEAPAPRVVSEWFYRGVWPPAAGVELHADASEIPHELLDVLVVPRLAVLGKTLEVHLERSLHGVRVCADLEERRAVNLNDAERRRIANVEPRLPLCPAKNGVGRVRGRIIVLLQPGDHLIVVKKLAARGWTLMARACAVSPTSRGTIVWCSPSASVYCLTSIAGPRSRASGG